MPKINITFVKIIRMNSFFNPNTIEAGCDEAGRGCLAGPVVAAAVILPQNHGIDALNDSKKLTERKRQELVPLIKEKAVAYGVAFVDETEIDKINILNASFLAMHRAVDVLNVRPQLLLIDGNRFNPYPEIEHVCIIKGDTLYQSIAAASILAKESRDDYMRKLHLKEPVYNWQKNKGYPTKSHKLAILENGISRYHRKSFKLHPCVK